LQPGFQHPLGLVLLRGDIADNLLGEPALGAGARDVGVRPAVAVRAQGGDCFLLGQRLKSRRLCGLWRECHRDAPLMLVVCRRGLGAGVRGTWVVQAQSPLTMVASRCTWVPSTSAIACRSAS